MFKDNSSLISVNLTSLNKTKLLSLISTFENCINLREFYLNGLEKEE